MWDGELQGARRSKSVARSRWLLGSACARSAPPRDNQHPIQYCRSNTRRTRVARACNLHRAAPRSHNRPPAATRTPARRRTNACGFKSPLPHVQGTRTFWHHPQPINGSAPPRMDRADLSPARPNDTAPDTQRHQGEPVRGAGLDARGSGGGGCVRRRRTSPRCYGWNGCWRASMRCELLVNSPATQHAIGHHDRMCVPWRRARRATTRSLPCSPRMLYCVAPQSAARQ